MAKLSIEKFYSINNKETTKAVDDFLLENIKNSQIIRLVKRRQQTSPTKIKSFFIRMGYEIGGGKNWNEIIPLCALCELLNLANYLIERGIDNGNQTEVNLGSKIRTLVFSSKYLASNEKKIFKQMVQGIDKYLKIDNEKLIWDKKLNQEKFLDIYQQKCYLVGGQYYAHCLELGFLKSKNRSLKIKKHLMKIGEIFGTAYQMVHEVADLLPEELKRFPEDFKFYQKQYNSIRKRKLTLPIYYAIYQWKNFDKGLFFKLVKKEDYKGITNLFLKSKIIKKCKTFIKQYIKTTDKEFNSLPSGEWVNCLKLAVNSANSNIFWKHFKKLYAEVA